MEMWVFSIETELSADPGQGIDVTGFDVVALDGGIGKIDSATYKTGSSQVVVDTGPWIFGKKVVLPARVIDRVDADEQNVYVHRTKNQIKVSPKFGETDLDESTREEMGRYYDPRGAGQDER